MLKIALTCSGTEDQYFLRSRYTNVLLSCAETAGFSDVVPVILPYVSDQAIIQNYAKMFDGFLFTGGVDIDPSVYGEDILPVCGEIDKGRDTFELTLARTVAEMKKPAFGICRGIQTMNVALGGTLWQDIHSQYCEEGKPHCVKDEKDVPRHRVHLSGCLRELVGQDVIITNSYHHQSVKKLGEGLCAVGHSDEGLTEAIVHQTLPFYRAVQWHPEMQPDGISQKLFESFLCAVMKT